MSRHGSEVTPTQARQLKALEDDTVNRKKVQRLYQEEKRMVRRRKCRKRALGTRTPMEMPPQPDQRWSLDFVADTFTPGRRFWMLAAGLQSGASALEARLAGTKGLGRAQRNHRPGALRYAQAPRPSLFPHQQTITTTNPGLSFWPDEKQGAGQAR